MEYQECNLNIRYDLPKEIWDKVPLVYEKMNGWIGFGKDGNGENGIPYWFSYNEEEKFILASVEPSGLQFSANMELNEWMEWISGKWNCYRCRWIWESDNFNARRQWSSDRRNTLLESRE